VKTNALDVKTSRAPEKGAHSPRCPDALIIIVIIIVVIIIV